jgi:hypothetical protein
LAIVTVLASFVCCGAAGPSLTEVLGLASQYVARVERAFPTVVLEETYEQTAETNKNLGGSTMGVTGGGGVAIVEGDTVKKKRRSRSEVVWSRRGQSPVTWSGVKSVIDLDGMGTSNPPGRLASLVSTPGGLDAQWAGLVTESRSDQLGPFDRDFNVALNALALLREDQRERLTFKKEGEERLSGVSAWKVSYVEQKGPAIWKSRGNVPLGTHGMFWIDPADGRVLRSRVEVGSGKTTEQFRIEVDYVPAPALGVLVPVEMREKYESDAGKLVGKALYGGATVVGTK